MILTINNFVLKNNMLASLLNLNYFVFNLVRPG